MAFSSRTDDLDAPLLEIELASSPGGFIAQFRGDLVAETTGALWGIERLLLNEPRVSLDRSGIRSVDRAGPKGTLKFVETLHGFGGRLIIGA